MKTEICTQRSPTAGPFQVGRFAGDRASREGVDADYIFGMSEIDAQHEEVERILMELQGGLDLANRGPRDQTILERLHQTLIFHFALEEAVMHLLSRPDTQEHCRAHSEILESLEKHMNKNPAGLTLHNQIKQPIELVCAQIRSHDADFVRDMDVLRGRLLRARDNALT